MKVLLNIIPDRLSDLVRKGEITERYYNPGDLFDEVHLLLINDDRPDPEDLRKLAGRAELFLHNLPLPSFLHTFAWQRIFLEKWLQAGVDVARRIQPDLLRCYGFHVHTYLTARIKQTLQIPAVLSLHGNPDLDYGRLYHSPWGKAYFWRWKSLAQAGLPAFDHAIAVYSPIVPYLEARGVRNFSVIHNTVGLGAVAKTDYRLQDGLVRCLCVGRQEREQKDQRPILEAIAQIDNSRLYLYGNGNLHDELIALAQTLGIADRVVFKTGVPNDQLMQELQAFDIYVYNSINAEISKTVIEAALVGLPIIHNERTPWLAEELSGDYIYRVENSASGYRQGILALAGDLDLRRRLGELARSHASRHWSPEITEGRVADLYRSLLGERR